MICSLASLKDENLETIRSYEKQTGKTLLAFSCSDVNAEELSGEELAKIKELEGRLGMVLVAVK
jgi:hypothetical protein